MFCSVLFFKDQYVLLAILQPLFCSSLLSVTAITLYSILSYFTVISLLPFLCYSIANILQCSMLWYSTSTIIFCAILEVYSDRYVFYCVLFYSHHSASALWCIDNHISHFMRSLTMSLVLLITQLYACQVYTAEWERVLNGYMKYKSYSHLFTFIYCTS